MPRLRYISEGHSDFSNDYGNCMPWDSSAGESLSFNATKIVSPPKRVADKKAALTKLLDIYYDEVTHITSLPHTAKANTFLDAVGMLRPNSVPPAFPALARLFSAMADLHPFNDANSRTRLFLLSTELTRMGSHPVMLEENGWSIYYYTTPRSMREHLLNGLCAFEYAVRHSGETPYAIGQSDYSLIAATTGCCPANASPNDNANHTGWCSPKTHALAHYEPKSGKCVEVDWATATQGREVNR